MNKLNRLYFPLALLLIFIFAQPAMAGEPPAPQELLIDALIFAIMIILTFIGGGYTILNRLQEKRSRFQKAISIIGSILAGITIIFYSLAFSRASFFFLGVMAIQRGLRMIKWGITSRSGRETPAYLLKANPRRLVLAGCFLVLIIPFIMNVAITFSEYTMKMAYLERRKGGREENLAGLVTVEIAKTRLTRKARELIREEKGEGSRFIVKKKALRPLDLKEENILIEDSRDGKGFTIYMLPLFLPSFPYNYLISRSQPTYRADETGKIRMMHVSKKDMRCTPDAPVVMQIKEEDIQGALDSIKNFWEVEE